MCVRSHAPPEFDKSPLKIDYATERDMSKEPCLHATRSRRQQVDLFGCMCVQVHVTVNVTCRCVHFGMYLGSCHSFTSTIALVGLLFSVCIYMAQFAVNLHLDLLYDFVVTF